jgi:hypothetical protein
LVGGHRRARPISLNIGQFVHVWAALDRESGQVRVGEKSFIGSRIFPIPTKHVPSRIECGYIQSWTPNLFAIVARVDFVGTEEAVRFNICSLIRLSRVVISSVFAYIETHWIARSNFLNQPLPAEARYNLRNHTLHY